MASSPSSILIVGSMAFDDLELPSGSFENVVGGAATFAAVASTLYAPTRVVAVVGDDFPQATLDQLAARGVDTTGVQRVPGKTFRWKGRYAPDLSSRETLDTQLNVFADFRPTLPASYRDSQIVLLGNIHPALQLEVLEQVEKPELVVADTMNFWISGERALLEKVLKRVDLLVINDEELRQLAGIHSIRKAVRAVLAMGPKRLIVKRGEHGAMLWDENGVFFAPAYPLETEVDPTGAGDSFAGALIGHLAEQGNHDRGTLRRALLNGATVASFLVEGVGTSRLLSVTKAEVAARLADVGRQLALD